MSYNDPYDNPLYAAAMSPPPSFNSFMSQRMLPPLDLMGNRPPAQYPAFPPELQESFGHKLLSTVMTPIQYAAETLNKPGRAVRGLLAGRPEELANLIPFSDTLGITDPAKQTTGRDLLEQAGVLGANTPGLDVGDIAGFGVDLLTDPLMWLGGVGTLTKAGKVAEAAGEALPRGIGAGIEAGQRSLLKVKPPIPFWEHMGGPSLEIGTGPGAAKLAKQAIDRPWEAFRYGTGLGRTLGANLDPAVGGMMTREGQELYSQMVPQPTYKAVLEQTIPWRREHERLFQAGLLGDEAHLKVMREAAEGLADPAQYTGTMADAATTGQKMRDFLKPQLAQLQKRGIDVDNLGDAFVDYAARFHYDDPRRLFGQFFKQARTQAGRFNEASRADILKGFPGGTEQIESLIRTPEVWNLPRDQAVDLVQAAKVGGRTTLSADELDKIAADSSRFVSFVRSLDPDKYLLRGERFFNANPVYDGIERTVRTIKQVKEADFAHELLKNAAVATKAPDADLVNVLDLFKQAGLTKDQWLEVAERGALKPIAAEGAQATFARNMGLDPLLTIGEGAGRQVKGIADYYVPSDIARDFLRVVKSWKAPDQIKPILQTFDNLQNLWKTTQTSLWPAFHARRVLSHGYYHLISGAAEGPGGFVGPFKDAYAALMGQQLPAETLNVINKAGGGAIRGVDDLLAEAKAAGITSTGQLSDITSSPNGIGALLGQPRGLITPAQALASRWDEAKQALADARGVPAKTTAALDQFMDLGRSTGNFTDNLGRLAHYIARREQGWTPAAAGQSVKRWFFDYADLTPTERQVLRRAIPFYTFARKNSELVLRSMFTEPGQALRGTIASSEIGRKDQGYFPPLLGEGLSYPVPGAGAGVFANVPALPIEEAFTRFKTAPTAAGTVGRNVESLISQLTPAVPLLYELASGRDPYLGRPVEDLQPFPTSSPRANAIINALPGSRAMTTARRLSSDRTSPELKALDLLTGVKVADLTPDQLDRLRAAEAKKLVEDALGESPAIKKHVEYYPNPLLQAVGLVPPDVGANLRLLHGMEQEGRSKAKAMRAAELFQPQPSGSSWF